MRKLVDGMLLFHGSYCEISAPDLEKCAPYKDFEKGFYLTSSYEQAKNFTILAYIAGTYGDIGTAEADNLCISRLLPERLEDQYCFRTEKAIACLKYVESEKICRS